MGFNSGFKGLIENNFP